MISITNELTANESYDLEEQKRIQDDKDSIFDSIRPLRTDKSLTFGSKELHNPSINDLLELIHNTNSVELKNYNKE